MGKHFALTLQLPKYGTEHKRQNALKFEHNWGMLVLAAGVIMLGAYLIQVNSFATKGYEIRSLQNKIDQLKEQQRTLEVQAAELQSLQRIQNDPAVLNMVPVSTISYVQNTSLTQR